MNRKFTKILLSVSLASSSINFSLAQTTSWFISPFADNTSNSTSNSTTYNSNASAVTIPATYNSNNPYTNTEPTHINTQNISSQTTNLITIPQNVLSVINNLKNKYNLNQSQVSALNQVARSYQYVLKNPPSTNAQAQALSIRDVAATDCASSRIFGGVMDESTTKIEIASLDTAQKNAIYDSYMSLLDENALAVPLPNPGLCEDEYSVANGNTNQSHNSVNSNIYNNTNNNPYLSNLNTFTNDHDETISSGTTVNLNGIVPDNEIDSKCLILTRFMQFGSKDSQVLQLQNFLMENGYLEMYPTGFFGRNTEFAVKEWQKRHSVDVRGWVGPNTRGSIAGVTCKSQAAFDKAFKGSVAVVGNTHKASYTSSSPKKVAAPEPVISNTVKTVVIAPTENPNYNSTSFDTNVVSSNNLSMQSGTFHLKRTPVNTLYFTYKANTKTDNVFMCLAKSGDSRCENITILQKSHNNISLGLWTLQTM